MIALGALALLVSLFLDWYGAGRFDATITAWTSFEVVDLLLAALSIAVLCAVAEGIALPHHEPRMPPALLWFAGPFTLLVVLVAIINPPPLVSGIDPTLEAGIWVALGGALVMTIGVAVSTLRVSVVVGGRERSRAGPTRGRKRGRCRPTPAIPSRRRAIPGAAAAPVGRYSEVAGTETAPARQASSTAAAIARSWIASPVESKSVISSGEPRPGARPRSTSPISVTSPRATAPAAKPPESSPPSTPAPTRRRTAGSGRAPPARPRPCRAHRPRARRGAGRAAGRRR